MISAVSLLRQRDHDSFLLNIYYQEHIEIDLLHTVPGDAYHWRSREKEQKVIITGSYSTLLVGYSRLHKSVFS